MQEIQNFITPDECKEIIKLIDANHSRSSVVVAGTDRSDITDHRTSSTSNLDTNNVIVNSIHKYLHMLNVTISIHKYDYWQL